MADSNIEKRVAETILQQPAEIHIGKKTFYAAPPSVATLILVSEAVSRLPELSNDNIMGETLTKAKDCRPLGEIVAIYILGAKVVNETVEVERKVQRRFGLIKRTVTVKQTMTRKDALADEVLEALTPKELNLLMSQILQQMQIGDFFGLTTFLTGVNLTRPTKVVEEN